MGKSVSVLLSVRNVEKYIVNCLTSLLDQTFNDFEIVIIDDLSYDTTRDKIKKFSDKRIKYFRNEKWIGLAQSRNKCLKYANGEYVFFTDGDCTVSRNWIAEGLKYLRNSSCIGVEGKTYYVSEEYKPTRSDSVIENKEGGQLMTCNIAYKNSVLKSIGGFDERFTYLEDRELAIRAGKFGKICFNPNMIVYHQKKTLNPRQFVQTAKILSNRVLLYKKHKYKPFFIWRIAFPTDLVQIVFPPLIFGNFFRTRYKTKEDFGLFPFIYIMLVYERLNFWEMCAKERVFLI